MKTTGMSHQLTALRRINGNKHFALFMEQGTGKTWVFLADAERLYACGQIDAMLVIAPKGVHVNWVRREIPKHLDVPNISRAWISGAGKMARRDTERILEPREDGEPPPLRILTINYDALLTADGFAFAKKFLTVTKAVIVCDESSRIKNPKAARTKKVMLLKPMAEVRRVGTGTPITQGPTDTFSQMEFCEEGLLGTSSYRAFVAEYSQLLDSSHPMMRKMIQKNPRIAWAQIVEKDEEGRPIYRNLDKLQRLLAPHSYRVLKKDCLDLPEKIYKNVYFEMTPAQRKAYQLMKNQFRYDLEGTVKTVKKLNAINKLQQITSGFILRPDGTPAYIADSAKPRLDALLEINEDTTSQYIVWAHFREEIKHIAAALRKEGRTVAEYHGGIGSAARETAVDGFQDGIIDVFVGQPQAGGMGLTLTNAETVVYYSNDYNLETRSQSEDRAHRIGTRKNVVYIDIVAQGSIDEEIADALQRKVEVASIILDDFSLPKQKIVA